MSDTSKVSILRAPLSAAIRRDQLVSTPQPSGVTTPRPVTTTRLIILARTSSLAVACSAQTARHRYRTRPLARRAHLIPQLEGITPSASAPPRVSGGPQALGRQPPARQTATLASALGVLFEKLHCVADGQNGFRRVVRNLTAKLFFEGHHELDRVETVRPEIVDEACTFDHLVGLDTQVLHDDLLHPLADITHRLNL